MGGASAIAAMDSRLQAGVFRILTVRALSRRTRTAHGCGDKLPHHLKRKYTNHQSILLSMKMWGDAMQCCRDRLGDCPRTGTSPSVVIPAKAGIQQTCGFLDSGFRRNDLPETFSDSLPGGCPKMSFRAIARNLARSNTSTSRDFSLRYAPFEMTTRSSRTASWAGKASVGATWARDSDFHPARS
jgi:hypothetical protein